MTQRRRTILTTLAAEPAFVSAQALHARLCADGHRISLTTVYRALHDFVTTGEVDATRSGNGTELFRAHQDPGHHHYLRCRLCGYSVSVRSDAVETWTSGVGAEHGFVDLVHTVEVLGTCARCRRGT